MFFTWLAGSQFIPRDAVLGRIKFPNEFSKLDGIKTTIQGSVHKRLQDSRCETWAFLAKMLKQREEVFDHFGLILIEIRIREAVGPKRSESRQHGVQEGVGRARRVQRLTHDGSARFVGDRLEVLPDDPAENRIGEWIGSVVASDFQFGCDPGFGARYGAMEFRSRNCDLDEHAWVWIGCQSSAPSDDRWIRGEQITG